MNEGNSNLGSETGSDLDSISLASEEDFAGMNKQNFNFTEKYLKKIVFRVKNSIDLRRKFDHS